MLEDNIEPLLRRRKPTENSESELLLRQHKPAENNGLEDKFDNATAIEIQTRLLELTSHYLNKSNLAPEKAIIFQNLKQTLQAHNGSSCYKQLLAFKAELDQADRGLMNIHRTGDWLRYLANALSILAVIPALVQAGVSYANYGTCRFWLPESQRAFAAIDQAMEPITAQLIT